MAKITAQNSWLLISECFEERNRIKRLGGTWDASKRVWVMAFTLRNYKRLIETLNSCLVDESVHKRLPEIEQWERDVRQIKKDAMSNRPMRFAVPGLKIPLYNYQCHGVHFALTNGDGVLLADSMGLGKTSQAIATASWMHHIMKAQHALIIVPAAVKWNWPLEIMMFTDLPYVVIDGKPEERIQQWQGKVVCAYDNKKHQYTYVPGKPFFTVVNYELIIQDLFGGRNVRIKDDDDKATIRKKQRLVERAAHRSAILQPIAERQWSVIIIDEIHGMKNHESRRSKEIKKLSGRFRMGLTGTPVDGRLEELHSIMEWIRPGLFTSKNAFLQHHAEFDYFGRVVKYKRVKEVREIIEPFFLRRLKEDVLTDLPAKTYQNIIIELDAGEAKTYRALVKKKHPATENEEAMVRAIRCKQFCDHPSLIEESGKGSKLQQFMEVLEELVKFGGEKAIIFTQYKMMLDIIDKEMRDAGYTFLRIDGDTPAQARARMQEEFKKPEYDAIIGTEAMSTGLNLIAGNYVLNYDDNWSPALMRQREDRAYRNGQTKPVTVINFICRDTIEERIRDVLYGKEVLSSEVLGDDVEDATLKRLDPSEIDNLL